MPSRPLTCRPLAVWLLVLAKQKKSAGIQRATRLVKPGRLARKAKKDDLIDLCKCQEELVAKRYRSNWMQERLSAQPKILNRFGLIPNGPRTGATPRPTLKNRGRGTLRVSILPPQYSKCYPLPLGYVTQFNFRPGPPGRNSAGHPPRADTAEKIGMRIV